MKERQENVVITILKEEIERLYVKESKLIYRCELLNNRKDIVKDLERTRFTIEQTKKGLKQHEKFVAKMRGEK